MKYLKIKILAASENRILVKASVGAFQVLDLPRELIFGSFEFMKEYEILIQESLIAKSIVW